jgi:hypothetical protein
MTDIRTQLIDALDEIWNNSDSDAWSSHRVVGEICDTVLSLPNIVIVERDALLIAIAAGIQGYACSHGTSYEHYSGSVAEAMHQLDRDAESIAQYIFTSKTLAAANMAEEW